MNKVLSEIFVQKTNKTHLQFLRYIFVGGFCTVLDMGSLFIMTSVFHVHYLISAALAFLVGITANYLLSILWVFESTGKVQKEITLFIIIGVGGLGLNELIMWLLVSEFGIFYMIAKAASTALVMVWNFGMRKKFVF